MEVIQFLREDVGGPRHAVCADLIIMMSIVVTFVISEKTFLEIRLN